jgi:hypothetical protein
LHVVAIFLLAVEEWDGCGVVGDFGQESSLDGARRALQAVLRFLICR